MSLHCDICGIEIPDNKEYHRITIDNVLQDNKDIQTRCHVVRDRIIEICYRCFDRIKNITKKEIGKIENMKS